MTLSVVGVRIVALAVSMFTAAPSSFGANALIWGPAVNGLRLAAAFGSDPSTSTLRVAVQNVASNSQGVMLGHEAGELIYDSLKFVAIAADGKQQELLHRSLYRAIAGLMLPFSIYLNAGEIHEWEFPMKDIIYASRTTATLDDLVKQGYSVQVRLETPWVGILASTTIIPAR